MSLINDALRRKDQEKKGPLLEKSDGSPMQPVLPADPSRSKFLGPILVVLIGIILLVSAILFWKGWQTKNELAAAAKQQASVPAPTAPVEPAVESLSIPATPVVATPAVA